MREGPTCKRLICRRREHEIHNSCFIVNWVYCQIPLFFNHPKLISVGFWFFFWLPEECPSFAGTRLQGYCSTQFQIPELSSVISCAILCPPQGIFLWNQGLIWSSHWGWSWMSVAWAPLKVTVPCRFREPLYKAESMRISSLKWNDFTNEIQTIWIQREFQ